MKKSLMLLCGIGIVAVVNSCDKGESNDVSSGPYFPEVKMIIQNNCLSCHSSTGYWQGRPIAFDSDSAIAQQYVVIKAAIADPVTPINKRMPEGGMLSAHDIAVIVKWFDQGGKITD